MTDPLREVKLLTAIEALENNIRQRELKLAEALKPVRNELNRYKDMYTAECAPLQPGDEIEYTPSGTKHAGIVRVEKVRCIEIPESWEYYVEVLSVGESREKHAVGRTMWISIRRSNTPTKLN